jgi:hypothetical protein
MTTQVAGAKPDLIYETGLHEHTTTRTATLQMAQKPKFAAKWNIPPPPRLLAAQQLSPYAKDDTCGRPPSGCLRIHSGRTRKEVGSSALKLHV